MCDEDTVGTFSDLGLEDERTVKDENFQVALGDVDINVSVRVPRGDGPPLLLPRPWSPVLRLHSFSLPRTLDPSFPGPQE
ncbi:mucin-3B-like [Leopardus geoffroyi]|uniref:mucin-3B-like n=1 Tax=Leopardus geoffroyi TaxID=46844 RepID=UPI001E25F35A|nr:mucin-3B-like [Leopardus geoffroyi]